MPLSWDKRAAFWRVYLLVMNHPLRHPILLVTAFLCLVAGGISYGIFQQRHIHPFISGHFADTAWCTSLYLSTIVLSERKLLHFADSLLLLSLPFLTEIMQAFRLMGGIFDWYDIIIYSIVLLSVNFFFTGAFLKSLKRTGVKRASCTWPVAAIVLFFVTAVASVPAQKTTYQKPKPQPCITHKSLAYSPVLIKVNLSGDYTMKDLQEAQRQRPTFILNELNYLSPGKYQLADGVTPNLNLYITLKTDSYGHYGAEVTGYVHDGDFFVRFGMDYVTLEKLYSDIAAKINLFVRNGWCSNCPGPCNP